MDRGKDNQAEPANLVGEQRDLQRGVDFAWIVEGGLYLDDPPPGALNNPDELQPKDHIAEQKCMDQAWDNLFDYNDRSVDGALAFG